MKCLAVLLLATALAACSTRHPHVDPDLLHITGELVYRDRVALPPNGTAQVTLADAAMADPVSPVAAQTEIELGVRQIPIPFELSADRWALSDRGSYVLQASIADADGRVLFTIASPLPIELSRADHHLGEVLLVRAGADTDLASIMVGREWVVEDIGGAGVIDFSRVTMRFSSDGRLVGNTGCNSYGGRYSLNGHALETSDLISTRKACAPALMDQETKFIDVLDAADRVDTGEHGALLIHSATGGSVRARTE